MTQQNHHPDSGPDPHDRDPQNPDVVRSANETKPAGEADVERARDLADELEHPNEAVAPNVTGACDRGMT